MVRPRGNSRISTRTYDEKHGSIADALVVEGSSSTLRKFVEWIIERIAKAGTKLCQRCCHRDEIYTLLAYGICFTK
jgi:hypothetical protein